MCNNNFISCYLLMYSRMMVIINSLAYTAIFSVQYVAWDKVQTFIFDHYPKMRLRSQAEGGGRGKISWNKIALFS